MGRNSEQGNDAGEIHDTVQATADADGSGLPPAVAASIPDKYQGYDLASDANNATVDQSDTYTEVLADDRTEELFVLEMCDLTWTETNQALSDNLVKDGQQGKLDFAGYYRQVAEQKIESVEPEVPEESLTVWLTGLNERLGKQLQQLLPDPVADIEEAEEKN